MKILREGILYIYVFLHSIFQRLNFDMINEQFCVKEFHIKKKKNFIWRVKNRDNIALEGTMAITVAKSLYHGINLSFSCQNFGIRNSPPLFFFSSFFLFQRIKFDQTRCRKNLFPILPSAKLKYNKYNKLQETLLVCYNFSNLRSQWFRKI